MITTDITYCTRECGNVECKRNVKMLMENQYTWKCVNVSMTSFEDCKEWRERECIAI
ncbi:MAG: hypothetical protein IKK84_00335 [Clostridia bacterium]|nr:hypothetical protein [Clostridia bacterium]